jgi:phage-related protein
MSESLTIELHNRQQARAALQEQVFPFLAGALQAGHRWILSVKPQTRSEAQNRVLHSRIGDIAKQLEWCGCKRDADTWKRLLTAAWLRARGESVEILPALDGHGVDVVFRHTSKLSRAECQELSEFVMAWGAERGIQWCIASLCGEVDQETGEMVA